MKSYFDLFLYKMMAFNEYHQRHEKDYVWNLYYLTNKKML